MIDTRIRGELYERDILDPLRRMEKDGKGKILELSRLGFGDRTLPSVAFTTGNIATVTAGFCPYAAFGTYETAMALCDKGIDGVTIFPTVTPEWYDAIVRTLRMIDEGSHATLVRDYFGLGTNGESPEPCTFRMYPVFDKIGWDDARKPKLTRVVIEAIRNSRVVFDLRNGNTASYIIFGTTVHDPREDDVDETIISRIESNGYHIAENVWGLGRTGRQKILSGTSDRLTASCKDLGVMNYVLNVPTLEYRDGTLGLVAMGKIVETNLSAIIGSIDLLR